MKICFIGATSFLGNSFADYFLNQNISISVFGRTNPQFPCDDFFALDLNNDEIPFSELLKFDIIYYFAGEGIQSDKGYSLKNLYNVNLFKIIEICDYLNNYSFNGIFISFGSYSEIGLIHQNLSQTEEEIVFSKSILPNDYSKSKRLLTTFIQSSEFRFKIFHLIIPTIYGPGENPNRLIPYLIRKGKNNEPIFLTHGNQIRQYLFVNDIPIIVDNLISLDIKSGIYNIEGPDNYSVKDMAFMILKYFSFDLGLIKFGSIQKWDNGLPYLRLDGSKLYNLIGDIKFKGLKEVLPKYYES
ncbi:MAG: NAD(P)-dependent oxidoreductase [Cytophagaceae bacterium]|nr:NAD(P)-dependent oxidoreductase [Cytophagaceae bacterium]